MSQALIALGHIGHRLSSYCLDLCHVLSAQFFYVTLIFFFKIESFLSGLYYFYYDKIFYCLLKNALTKCEYYIPSLEIINSRLRITKPGCSLSFDSDALWALRKKIPSPWILCSHISNMLQFECVPQSLCASSCIQLLRVGKPAL